MVLLAKLLHLRHSFSIRRIAIMLAGFVIVLGFTTIYTYNAFAVDDIVETTFFGNLKDDGSGCGVYMILNSVIDILSIGIGITGAIGITIVGIQYLTAKGNEEKTRKAKHRILEIVIGMATYALLYAGIQWLLPGGKLNDISCTTVSDTELAQIKAQEEAERQQLTDRQSASGNKSSSQKNEQGSTSPSTVCTNCAWSERIAQTAELLSWPLGTPAKKYRHNGISKNNKKWSDLKGAKPNKAFQDAIDTVWPSHSFRSVTNVGADCGVFVGVVVRYSGFDPKSTFSCPNGIKYYTKSKRWKKVSSAKRGDICIRNGCHTRIYLGNNLSAEANHYGKKFGHITKGKCSGYKIFRANP